MKKIKYLIKAQTGEYNAKTKTVDLKETLVVVITDYSAENEEQAKESSYNGEYEIFEDGEPELALPTQLDVIEAQVAYTAMMTDTLLEV